jgi:hypothetical protein
MVMSQTGTSWSYLTVVSPEFMTAISALTSPVPVSMLPRRLSPILQEII